MTGDVEIRHRFETRSDQAGLPKWLKCAPPGARYGICGAQVHKDNLKTWEVMISHVNSKYTAAFIEFDDRQKMSQHFVDHSEEFELRDQYPSNDAIINVLLDEAAKNVTFGGNLQVYGLPFHFMYFWLLCVLHIDNNEYKTFLRALLDASVRRFQKRKDVLTSTDIDRLDFDSLDVYFHGDELDNLDQDSSLHKLVELVKSKVQPKMAAITKQMLSSDKKEREKQGKFDLLVQ